MSTGDRTLGAWFATRPNALHAVRLLLAADVILWHAWTHSGRDSSWALLQLAGFLPVDAFFAISGFLIARSLQRDPNIRRYTIARASRILPGLWGCLIVSAFALVPIAGTLSSTLEGVTVRGQLWYVLANAGTFVGSPGIVGVPDDALAAQVWNLSLHTLWWELLCYVALGALAYFGLLKVRIVATVAAATWLLSLMAWSAGLPWGVLMPMQNIARYGLMFSVGALLWLLRDKIPVSGVLATAAGVSLLAGSLLPNYRIVAAPAVAYLCLYVALLLAHRWPRLVLRHDISYGVYLYGGSVQQVLFVAGLGSASWLAFTSLSVLLVVPLAVGSWLLLERPALRAGRDLARKSGHRARDTRLAAQLTP